VDGLVDSGRVADVHVLALAVGGTLSLECPDEADGLVLMLGDGRILSFHHVLDGAVARVTEAGHHVSVGVGVEDRDGAALVSGTGVVASRRAWSAGAGGPTGGRIVHHGVPGHGERAQVVEAVGADFLADIFEGGSTGKGSEVGAECCRLGPVEVGLLEVVEDLVAQIHSDGVGTSPGVDGVHAGSNLVDGLADVLGNSGIFSMEHIDKDGPSVELLGGMLRRGRVASVNCGQVSGVGHGGVVSSHGEFSLARALDNLLVFGMSFTADRERRESFSEEVSDSTDLEGSEYLVD